MIHTISWTLNILLTPSPPLRLREHWKKKKGRNCVRAGRQDEGLWTIAHTCLEWVQWLWSFAHNNCTYQLRTHTRAALSTISQGVRGGSRNPTFYLWTNWLSIGSRKPLSLVIYALLSPLDPSGELRTRIALGKSWQIQNKMNRYECERALWRWEG